MSVRLISLNARREPVLKWLERNSLDPNKIVDATVTTDPIAYVTVAVRPDETLTEWVSSLGFDPEDVVHVHVTGTHVEITYMERNPETGKIALTGPPENSVPVTATAKIPFA